MAKDEVIMIRMTTKLKERLEVVAKEQDLSLPDYIRETLENWSTFDTHFLEKIYVHAQAEKIPIPIVIQNLLTSYLSQDYGFMEVFGKPTKAYSRAFQHYLDGGLLEGNDLSELVLQQTKEDIATLPKRTKEDIATLLGAGKAAKVTGGQGVKEEAKYTPMARAKPAKP